MDKSKKQYNEDQGKWGDYQVSEEISVHLPDIDNESNDNEILPRNQKRAFIYSFSLLNRTGRG